MEGQPCCIILCKKLDHLQILVSERDPGINTPQILSDDCAVKPCLWQRRRLRLSWSKKVKWQIRDLNSHLSYPRAQAYEPSVILSEVEGRWAIISFRTLQHRWETWGLERFSGLSRVVCQVWWRDKAGIQVFWLSGPCSFYTIMLGLWDTDSLSKRMVLEAAWDALWVVLLPWTECGGLCEVRGSRCAFNGG